MSDHMTQEPEFPELARLADGSLPSERQDELRAQIQQSPRLAQALTEQQRAIALVRSTEEVSAPDSLRASLDRLPATGEPARVRRHPRWRLRLGLPVATALAAAAAAVVLLVASGNRSPGPTLPQTTRVALAAATLPAPAESSAHRDQLNAQVDGVPFPYWGRTVKWRTLGRRTDTLGGRRVETVFYSGRDKDRVGYSIVSGAPVPVSGGTTVVRHGVRYTLIDTGHARLVTWQRAGHTCVIAGRWVKNSTLLALAAAEPGRPVRA